MRWIGAVALVAAMSMTLLLPAAWASQGGRYTGSGYNGVRANISGSSSVPSTGGVIATVRVQSAMSGDPGLFQVGHIKSGSSFTSDCGTGTIGIMVERRNPGGQYFCDAFFGVFGTNYRFGAVRASGTSGDWKAYQDGTQIGPTRTLSFGSGKCDRRRRVQRNGALELLLHVGAEREHRVAGEHELRYLLLDGHLGVELQRWRLVGR